MDTTQRDLAFVQFPHPRKEHAPKEDFMKWSTARGHARKFMVTPGEYVTRAEAQEKWTRGKGEIVLWGEWEAQSQVKARFTNPKKWHPQVLHRPVLGAPPDAIEAPKGYQNTDPFVFGDRMRYTICRQHREDGRSVSLRRLAPWSVILFGSSADGGFILDTAFVVSNEIGLWCVNGYPEVTLEMTDPFHHRTTIEPVAVGIPEDRRDIIFNLYNGVTFAERQKYGGMFSFVPCRLSKESPTGFARPTIVLDGIINPKSTRTFRSNIMGIKDDRDKVVSLWEEVVKQVIRQKCHLAHSIPLPLPMDDGGSLSAPSRRNGRLKC